MIVSNVPYLLILLGCVSLTSNAVGILFVSPRVRQSESPRVRESQSPTVRQSDSPRVRESQTPTVRQSESPRVPDSNSPTVRQGMNSLSHSESPLKED
ncbi:hypothetical protein [Microcoleus sp. EPA2]|uniref:hypothetical protein n=1 Tax=Microcoleus sp. EPA2 TaxID=2841654 RepID=UPI00312B2C6E